jgi:hypothetical protein
MFFHRPVMSDDFAGMSLFTVDFMTAMTYHRTMMHDSGVMFDRVYGRGVRASCRSTNGGSGTSDDRNSPRYDPSGFRGERREKSHHRTSHLSFTTAQCRALKFPVVPEFYQ